MSAERPILTTRQGHPVRDNQSMRTVGERGPATLENYQFIEKITHFDRMAADRPAGPAPTAGSRPTAPSATSRPRNTPAPAC